MQGSTVIGAFCFYYNTDMTVCQVLFVHRIRNRRHQCHFSGRCIETGVLHNNRCVRFDQNDMSQLIDAIDELKEGDRIIGWYHSHLGCGCFMSETDIATQNGLFGGRIGFAIVIDPELRQLKVFDSTVDDPQSVQIIVME